MLGRGFCALSIFYRWTENFPRSCIPPAVIIVDRTGILPGTFCGWWFWRILSKRRCPKSDRKRHEKENSGKEPVRGRGLPQIRLNILLFGTPPHTMVAHSQGPSTLIIPWQIFHIPNEKIRPGYKYRRRLGNAV
jgi:hypothetical protein